MKKIFLYILPIAALAVLIVGNGKSQLINLGSAWINLPYYLIGVLLILIWIPLVLRLILKR